VRPGIKANRNTLETAARYSHEHGLMPRLVKLDEVFAASSLEEFNAVIRRDYDKYGKLVKDIGAKVD
jgi:hypothetical protein